MTRRLPILVDALLRESHAAPWDRWGEYGLVTDQLGLAVALGLLLGACLLLGVLGPPPADRPIQAPPLTPRRHGRLARPPCRYASLGTCCDSRSVHHLKPCPPDAGCYKPEPR